MEINQSFKEYFKLLNFKPEKPSLESVGKLQQKHLAELCFTSLAVLLKQPISLDINDIIKKVVIKTQGGYCFEHNKLMHDALKSLGYKVRFVIGRVINNQDIDSPRTHRITLLEWKSEHYLVDVGFGANAPRAPIKIKAGQESHQNGTSYRLTLNAQKDYQLELIIKDGYFSLYTFNLNHCTEADCTMGNFYSAHHPKAVFVNNLVVSRVYPELTLSLRNKSYHRIAEDHTEVVNIETPLQLQKIISDDFQIEVSEDECEIIYQKTFMQ